MITRTLNGIDWYEWKIDISLAQECIRYIESDKKFPENGGRDRFYEFFKVNFIDDKFALMKKIFWSNMLRMERDEAGFIYQKLSPKFKYDESPDLVLKLAKYVWDMKPNCTKYASKDFECRRWYLETMKLICEFFITTYNKLSELDRYIKTKYSIEFSDIKDEYLNKIIREYVFRDKLPVINNIYEVLITIPSQPVEPKTPTQPVAPTLPISFEKPKEPKPEIPVETEELEIKKAEFDPKILLFAIAGFLIIRNLIK